MTEREAYTETMKNSTDKIIYTRPTFPRRRFDLASPKALAYLHGIKEIGTTLTALEGLQSKGKSLCKWTRYIYRIHIYIYTYT